MSDRGVIKLAAILLAPVIFVGFAAAINYFAPKSSGRTLKWLGAIIAATGFGTVLVTNELDWGRSADASHRLWADILVFGGLGCTLFGIWLIIVGRSRETRRHPSPPHFPRK